MTESLASLTPTEFSKLVNAAFKNYNSVLALARSPLANSSLVSPLLVLDDVSPTANERGNALRILLLWAVNQLAPDSLHHSSNQERLFDDPTWREPHWWRYNILRHRYLEPLHPDYFVEGGRFTETLMALTGIPSTDTFFDERNRAIREVSQWLHQQLQHGQADGELQQLSLEEAYQPLMTQRIPKTLLDIAATFDDVFPRFLLTRMAQNENLSEIDSSLNYLISHRYLLVDNETANLWLSPVLQRYVYVRLSQSILLARHHAAAGYFAEEQDVLRAANHYIYAQCWSKAAEILLEHATELINELELDELSILLRKFETAPLNDDLMLATLWLLCDVFIKNGRKDEALATCRRLLKLSNTLPEQARIYHRMGKLYEKHNQLHALTYYQQAFERYDIDDSGLLDLLKDRAWFFILRKEWQKAEQDLVLSLQRLPDAAKESRADIFDALASLYGEQQKHDHALKYAQNSLGLREEIGDLSRVANSFINMGLIYSSMGDYHHAIAAYEEAMVAYKKMGNQELIATALLNIGMAYHLSKNLPEATQYYQRSLTISNEIGFPLAEVRARYNLAEALAELENGPDAYHHWKTAYQLSERCGFDDELVDLRKLQAQLPVLQRTNQSTETYTVTYDVANTPSTALLEPEEKSILQLAKDQGRLTAKLLMETTHVSKATANRRLVHLVEQGHLQKYGKGRGTYYALTPASLSTKRSGMPSEPSEQPSNFVNWQDIQPNLKRQMTSLAREFSVNEIGIVQVEQPETMPIRLLIRFQNEPELAHFFALEQHLISSLGVEIDLVPANSPRINQFGNWVDAVCWVVNDEPELLASSLNTNI
ncbi:MAG: tetratricopeptide repeat protein [Chloroflexota bacterium]